MTEPADNLSGEQHVDVRTQQVAAVYAKALLGASQAAGNTADVVGQFGEVSALLAGQPQFARLLDSMLISEEEKQGILERVFSSRISPTLNDFLRILSRRGRLALLRPIEVELRRQYDESRGVVRVQVITAAALDSASAKSLKDGLRALIGGEPELDASVDPDLIGGAVLRVGDTVYDGSVARQLEQLRSQIINRSVHEIQSRRDRFRYSGGN